MKNFSTSIVAHLSILSIVLVGFSVRASQEHKDDKTEKAGKQTTNNPTAPIPNIPGFEPAPRGSKVLFLNLRNRQVIPRNFKVKFGVEGMKIAPAGDMTPGTGHHHLIIDGNAIAPGQVVPTNENHLHFGKGQTEAVLDLTPGPHKLTLQFANGAHLSYGPELSGTVDVVVK